MIPTTPSGSYTSRPRLAFMIRLPCGTSSTARARFAFSAQKRAASSATSISLSIDSTSGLPDSAVILAASASRSRSSNCWNLRRIAIRRATPRAFQDACAARARLTAAFTSSGDAMRCSLTSSPVAGLRLVNLWPSSTAFVLISPRSSLLILYLHQPKTGGRRGRSCRRTVFSLEDSPHIVWRPGSFADEQECPHQVSHHVVQESVSGDGVGDLIAFVAPRRFENGAHIGCMPGHDIGLRCRKLLRRIVFF